MWVFQWQVSVTQGPSEQCSATSNANLSLYLNASLWIWWGLFPWLHLGLHLVTNVTWMEPLAQGRTSHVFPLLRKDFLILFFGNASPKSHFVCLESRLASHKEKESEEGEGIKALFDIGLRDFSPCSNNLILKGVMVTSVFATNYTDCLMAKRWRFNSNGNLAWIFFKTPFFYIISCSFYDSHFWDIKDILKTDLLNDFLIPFIKYYSHCHFYVCHATTA